MAWELEIRQTVRRNTQQYTATHSNTLQHTATHCNTQQYTATHWRNTLEEHTVTRCNTLQHTFRTRGWVTRAAPANDGVRGITLQHTATHCNTLQHAATHCNTLIPETKWQGRPQPIMAREVATAQIVWRRCVLVRVWGSYESCAGSLWACRKLTTCMHMYVYMCTCLYV